MGPELRVASSAYEVRNETLRCISHRSIFDRARNFAGRAVLPRRRPGRSPGRANGLKNRRAITNGSR